jgi:DNA-binding NtrC family response regulator
VIDVGDLPEAVQGAPPVDREAAGGEDLPLHDAVAALEKRLIVRALERAKGNRSAAARLRGIGRPLLYAKMDEHGLGGRGSD